MGIANIANILGAIFGTRLSIGTMRHAEAARAFSMLAMLAILAMLAMK